jgi:hypothetical protein
VKLIVDSRLGKHLSDTLPIYHCLKEGDALSPLLFNFACKCAIMRARAIQDGLKLNQLLVYTDDVNNRVLGEAYIQ